MEYVIEGTISEITFNDKGKIEYFKINGTEGFALQKKMSGKTERFNVLCEEENGSNAILFKSDSELKCDKKFLPTLSTALASGKRINIILYKCEEQNTKGNIEITGKQFILKKLSLLSN